MLMADTLAIFLVIIGFLIALPGLWLLCRGLWPEIVGYASTYCKRTLWKPFLIGIPVTVLAVGVAIALSKLKQPAGGIGCIGLLCLYVTYASAGVAGLATVIGERLPSPADNHCPWRATIRGGVVLELSFLLPFLGWFVLLPSSLILGAGATTRAILGGMKRTKKRPDAQAAEAGDAIQLSQPVIAPS